MAEIATAEKAKENLVKSSPKKPAELTNLNVRNRFVRNAPDKIRYVCKAIVGREINESIARLSFLPQSSRKPLIQTLKMALNQLKAKDLTGDWFIKSIAVDEGPKLKRRRIVHQGRATAILKRLSHITIYLQASKPMKKNRIFKKNNNFQTKLTPEQLGKVKNGA